MVWDDWREDLYGEMDTEENRKEYPDGFEWTCCGESGEKAECEIGRHRDWKATGGKVDWRLPIGKDEIGAFWGVKRVRSRYAQCGNCEEEFDVTVNEPSDCRWHEAKAHPLSRPLLL